MLKELWKDRKKRWIIAILLLGSAGAALKCIFVSLQMDEEYAVSMSYRLLLGDKLFAQIWDPHQTSAFLIEFLIWIYQKIFHTTTYVVIWIRTAGVLIQLAISCYLCRALRHVLSEEHSFYLAVVYFNLLPKSYVMPEFSNMMVWGLTLLLICLSRMAVLQGRLGQEKKEGWNWKMTLTALEAGGWLCFVTLSYPSCILLFPFVVWYLWKYDSYRGRTIGIVTVVCLAAGGGYIAYLLSYMTLPEFWENIKSLVASCGSHSVGIQKKAAVYGRDIMLLLIFSAGYLAVAALLGYWLNRGKKRTGEEEGKNSEKRLTFMFLLLIAAFVLQFIHWILMLWKYEYSYPFAVYVFIFGFAFYLTGKLREKYRELVKLWLWGNVVMYAAILLLTNLTLFTSLKYLMPGVIMGAAVLLVYAKETEPAVFQKYAGKLLVIWCLVAIFVKGWAYTDNDGLMKNITCVGNILSGGPGKGIITEYMQGYMQECTQEEFKTYIRPGDNLMVLDSNTLCYLYQDVHIASSTTICTPTFDENLLDYWERNPGKYPDVIAVRCWYGELKWDADSWIMHWIEEDFGAAQVIDGKYYRYYIRE